MVNSLTKRPNFEDRQTNAFEPGQHKKDDPFKPKRYQSIDIG